MQLVPADTEITFEDFVPTVRQESFIEGSCACGEVPLGREEKLPRGIIAGVQEFAGWAIGPVPSSDIHEEAVDMFDERPMGVLGVGVTEKPEPPLDMATLEPCEGIDLRMMAAEKIEERNDTSSVMLECLPGQGGAPLLEVSFKGFSQEIYHPVIPG